MARCQRMNALPGLTARTRVVVAVMAMMATTLLCACSTLASFDPFEMGSSPYERQAAALRAYNKGEDAQAESLYLGLLRLSPSDAETHLRLGNLYARSGRPDRAADSYIQTLMVDPADTRAWYNLGIVRQRQAQAALIEAHARLPQGDPRRARVETLATCVAPWQAEAALTSSPTAFTDQDATSTATPPVGSPVAP
jgi:cytochrome c-type biogenesis protein CcmH/NrfG